jgi:hypothetical protein
VAFSEWLNETVLWPVPHRKIVLRAWEEAVPEGTIRPEEGAAPTGNNEHLERLKALGYVQ